MNDDQELWICAFHLVEHFESETFDFLAGRLQFYRWQGDNLAMEICLSLTERVTEILSSHAFPH